MKRDLTSHSKANSGQNTLRRAVTKSTALRVWIFKPGPGGYTLLPRCDANTQPSQRGFLLVDSLFSQRRSPNRCCASVTATIAAVSVLRILEPRLTGVKPLDSAFSNSRSLQPPSDAT